MNLTLLNARDENFNFFEKHSKIRSKLFDYYSKSSTQDFSMALVSLVVSILVVLRYYEGPVIIRENIF